MRAEDVEQVGRGAGERLGAGTASPSTPRPASSAPAAAIVGGAVQRAAARPPSRWRARRGARPRADRPSAPVAAAQPRPSRTSRSGSPQFALLRSYTSAACITDQPASTSPTRHESGHAHVGVEGDVGAFTAERVHRCDLDAGRVHRHEEHREALVLRLLGIGAGQQEDVVRLVRHRREHLLPVDHPLVAVRAPPASARRRRPTPRRARCSRGSTMHRRRGCGGRSSCVGRRCRGERASPPPSTRCPCRRRARPAPYSSCISAVISTGLRPGRRPRRASRRRGSRVSAIARCNAASCIVPDACARSMMSSVRCSSRKARTSVGTPRSPGRGDGRVRERPLPHRRSAISSRSLSGVTERELATPSLGGRTAARRTRA